jgi:hypothetical protein
VQSPHSGHGQQTLGRGLRLPYGKRTSVASPGAGYITGETLHVNGGMYMV